MKQKIDEEGYEPVDLKGKKKVTVKWIIPIDGGNVKREIS